MSGIGSKDMRKMSNNVHKSLGTPSKYYWEMAGKTDEQLFMYKGFVTVTDAKEGLGFVNV